MKKYKLYYTIFTKRNVVGFEEQSEKSQTYKFHARDDEPARVHVREHLAKLYRDNPKWRRAPHPEGLVEVAERHVSLENLESAGVPLRD